MSKKKLARAIGVCIIAIAIIVIVALFSACESSLTPPTYGLELDGVDDCVALGNATGLGFTSQDFTIEAWIKPGTVTRRMQIFTRHKYNSDGYRFEVCPTGQLAFYTFQSSANQYTVTPFNVVTEGNWSHVAVIRQGASVRIFVDGVDRTSVPNAHIDPAYVASRNASIGINYAPEAFQGSITEIRVWNYARTESQIEADMSKELIGTEEGLIAYWKLNEGSGTIAHDSTANNNTGTLVGGPVWLTGGG